MGYRAEKKFDDIFSRLDTIHERNRQMDRQTDNSRQQRPRLRIASRGKKDKRHWRRRWRHLAAVPETSYASSVTRNYRISYNDLWHRYGVQMDGFENWDEIMSMTGWLTQRRKKGYMGCHAKSAFIIHNPRRCRTTTMIADQTETKAVPYKVTSYAFKLPYMLLQKYSLI